MNRLDICNLAIGRIGVGTQHRLAVFEEDTEAGRACRELFPFAVRYVAREFAWPFLRTVEEGQLAAGDAPGGYLYQYSYPPNAAALLGVGEAGTTFDRLPLVSAQEASTAAVTGVILSDVENAVVWYTALPDFDYDIRDHGFCDATAWLLARELAPALKADPKMWQLCDNGYSRSLPNAMAMALRESRPGPQPLPASLAAR